VIRGFIQTVKSSLFCFFAFFLVYPYSWLFVVLFKLWTLCSDFCLLYFFWFIRTLVIRGFIQAVKSLLFNLLSLFFLVYPYFRWFVVLFNYELFALLLIFFAFVYPYFWWFVVLFKLWTLCSFAYFIFFGLSVLLVIRGFIQAVKSLLFCLFYFFWVIRTFGDSRFYSNYELFALFLILFFWFIRPIGDSWFYSNYEMNGFFSFPFFFLLNLLPAFQLAMSSWSTIVWFGPLRNHNEPAVW